ncbi:MAG: DUF3105 domain-containing protein [Actinobacteria bacterium]|nr:DUF3105 domain-containing protein [Actinomycetota bacterium]
MAKKKRKKQHRPPGRTAAAPERPAPARREDPGPGISPAAAARRDRKDEARRHREAALRQLRRREILRRVLVYGAVVAAIAVAVIFFVSRRAQEEETRTEADRIARAVGCTEIQTDPEDSRGATHVPAGDVTYEEQPPTNGPHRPNWLDPGVSVYDSQPDVLMAVHNLEHAYMIIWYRQGTLDPDVVSALEEFARSTGKTIVAPYGSLPEGTDLAFTAWRQRQTCPTGMTAEEATTLAQAFSGRGRGLAPEPQAV